MVLGLCCSAGFSLAVASGDRSSCSAWAFHCVVEHGLEGSRASVAVVCGLSSWGSWALEHRLSSCGDSRGLVGDGMWYLPGPGIKSMSPALAGRFLTTEPPGKPPSEFLSQNA